MSRLVARPRCCGLSTSDTGVVDVTDAPVAVGVTLLFPWLAGRGASKGRAWRVGSFPAVERRGGDAERLACEAVVVRCGCGVALGVSILFDNDEETHVLRPRRDSVYTQSMDRRTGISTDLQAITHCIACMASLRPADCHTRPCVSDSRSRIPPLSITSRRHADADTTLRRYTTGNARTVRHRRRVPSSIRRQVSPTVRTLIRLHPRHLCISEMSHSM